MTLCHRPGTTKKMKLLRTALACLLACVSLTVVKVLVILRRDVQHWKVPLCSGLSCKPRQDLRAERPVRLAEVLLQGAS